MVSAVIFDMDGVIVDSEPMWREAERVVFSSVGVTVTEGLTAKTASMTTREVTRFWYSYAPWHGKSLSQVEKEVIDYVEALIIKNAVIMQGVQDVLEMLSKRQIKIGLSTNSPIRLALVVLNKLGIAEYFNVVSSSEFEIAGKPHPAVYLSTAKKLGVDPRECLVFEDSISGMLAAKKAKMHVIAIPPSSTLCETNIDSACFHLANMSDFTLEMLESFE
jgi:mannitol-1-/sugar-/sorbitol-6-/2-deoxyglucose-6-phosphatase